MGSQRGRHNWATEQTTTNVRTSRVKEFSFFLHMGRCKSRGSLQSLLWRASAVLASALCSPIRRPLGAQHQGSCRGCGLPCPLMWQQALVAHGGMGVSVLGMDAGTFVKLEFNSRWTMSGDKSCWWREKALGPGWPWGSSAAPPASHVAGLLHALGTCFWAQPPTDALHLGCYCRRGFQSLLLAWKFWGIHAKRQNKLNSAAAN